MILTNRPLTERHQKRIEEAERMKDEILFFPRRGALRARRQFYRNERIGNSEKLRNGDDELDKKVDSKVKARLTRSHGP